MTCAVRALLATSSRLPADQSPSLSGGVVLYAKKTPTAPLPTWRGEMPARAGWGRCAGWVGGPAARHKNAPVGLLWVHGAVWGAERRLALRALRAAR